MVCWVQYLSVLVLVVLGLSRLNRLHNPQTWDPCGFQASGVGAVADYTADPNPSGTWGSETSICFPFLLCDWAESDFWQLAISNFTPPSTFSFFISCVCWWWSPYCVSKVWRTDLHKASHHLSWNTRLFLCTAGFSADSPPHTGMTGSSRLVKDHTTTILKCRDVLQPSLQQPTCPEDTAEPSVHKSYPHERLALFFGYSALPLDEPCLLAKTFPQALAKTAPNPMPRVCSRGPWVGFLPSTAPHGPREKVTHPIWLPEL